MLIPHFYSVKEFNFTDNQLKAIIELNPAHDVFKGHFPNNPVTPGVCMLQVDTTGNQYKFVYKRMQQRKIYGIDKS